MVILLVLAGLEGMHNTSTSPGDLKGLLRRVLTFLDPRKLGYQNSNPENVFAGVSCSERKQMVLGQWLLKTHDR